jgi:DNA/RNA-binding domain of Phe-tRNA-synthetase-like protein
MRIDISAITADFPDFRAAVLVCDGLTIAPARSAALDAFVSEVESEARQRWRDTDLSAIPGVAAWRKAYRQFGIKKTSYRSSVERLVKNALAGAPLPRINAFVDAYNALSLQHVLPAGADDLDHIRGDLAFRYSRDGDDFRDMGALDADGAPLSEPPKPREVVYADEAKVLCRRWNWRQDARSVIRPDTRRAVVTLQANGVGDPAQAAAELSDLVSRECNGRVSIALADAANPMRELAFS